MINILYLRGGAVLLTEHPSGESMRVTLEDRREYVAVPGNTLKSPLDPEELWVKFLPTHQRCGECLSRAHASADHYKPAVVAADSKTEVLWTRCVGCSKPDTCAERRTCLGKDALYERCTPLTLGETVVAKLPPLSIEDVDEWPPAWLGWNKDSTGVAGDPRADALAKSAQNTGTDPLLVACVGFDGAATEFKFRHRDGHIVSVSERSVACEAALRKLAVDAGFIVLGPCTTYEVG